MKQATVYLKLSKENHVYRKNVTPIEAMLLVSMHHKNVGDTPIELRDITEEAECPDIEVLEEIDIPLVVDGKTVVVDGKVQNTKGTKKVKRQRSVDEELDRLRARYGSARIDLLSGKVRDMPTTFKEAIERGTKITLSTGGMSERAATISTTNLV